MDEKQRKTALRMIPYGLYLLTASGKQGDLSIAVVNWVSQASFDPPLIVVCVKAGSHIHELIGESMSFALNVFGKGQGDLAVAFFRPQERKRNTVGGKPFHPGKTGSPIFEDMPAFIECQAVDSVARGDHTIFVGEVVAAGVEVEPEGRPDEVTLRLADLGENIFYGG